MPDRSITNRTAGANNRRIRPRFQNITLSHKGVRLKAPGNADDFFRYARLVEALEYVQDKTRRVHKHIPSLEIRKPYKISDCKGTLLIHWANQLPSPLEFALWQQAWESLNEGHVDHELKTIFEPSGLPDNVNLGKALTEVVANERD